MQGNFNLHNPRGRDNRRVFCAPAVHVSHPSVTDRQVDGTHKGQYLVHTSDGLAALLLLHKVTQSMQQPEIGVRDSPLVRVEHDAFQLDRAKREGCEEVSGAKLEQ